MTAPPQPNAPRPVVWLIAAGLLAALWHLLLPWGTQRLHLDDAFYHLAEVRTWAREGLFGGITTLPRTVLGEAGPDHHFLFHVLIAPLALLDAEPALRLGAGLLAAASTLCVGWWLHRSQVPWPWLWLLLLLGASEVYGFRLGLLRAQAVDIPLLLAGLWQVLHGRAATALLLGFAFAWTHHGATLYGPVALLALLGQRLAGQPLQVRAALYLMAGVALGFVLNPWTPQSLEYLFFHTLWKTQNPLGLDVGAEWLPATPAWIAVEAWPLHLALVLGAANLLRQPAGGGLSRLRPDAWALGGLTALFLLLTLRHGRFADHLVAVELCLCAVVWRDGPLLLDGAALRRQLAVAAALVLVALASWRWAGVRGYVDRGWLPGDYATAGHWLDTHAKPQELVVNLRWEDYSFLTYFAPQQRFLTGLDPNYLAYADPKTYLVWDRLGTTRMPADVAVPLQQLHARYLVGPPNRYLDQHPQLQRVLADPNASIWQVKDNPSL